MPYDQPTPPQSKKTPAFSLYNTDDKNIAIGMMSTLAHFDGRLADRPFSQVMNEIYACATHQQYAIACLKYISTDDKPRDTPVGYLAWGLMNPMVSAVYGKSIRQLSPAEFKSGDLLWIVQFVSPFGFRDELYNYVVENVDVLRSTKKLTLDYGEEIPQTLLDAEQFEHR